VISVLDRPPSRRRHRYRSTYTAAGDWIEREGYPHAVLSPLGKEATRPARAAHRASG
jgi:hypothetical protein